MATAVELDIVLRKPSGVVEPLKGIGGVKLHNSITDQTVYSDEALTLPIVGLQTDTRGRVNGWVPQGTYDVIIDGETTVVEAVSGTAAAVTTPAGLVTLTPGSSSRNVIQSTGDFIGLVVKSFAGQTATLQQWQDSSGAAVAQIDPTGIVRASIFGSIAGGKASFAANSDTGGFVLATGAAGNKGIVVRAAVTQTANMMEFQDSSLVVQAKFDSAGNLSYRRAFNAANDFGATLSAAPAASQIGLVVRGAVSQTSHLQDWQDSSGTVQTFINAAGVLVANNASSPNMLINPTNAASIGLVVKGAVSQSGNLLEIQDSAANIRVRVNSAGALVVANANSPNFLVNPTGAAAIGQVIKGAASQSADLLEYQDSSNNVLAAVSLNGKMWTGGGAGLNSPQAQLSVTSSGATVVSIAVQGASGQSGNLQEWQFNGGTIAARVSAAGSVIANGRLIGGTATVLTNVTHQLFGSATTDVVTVVRGVASQTADLQQWQDSGAVANAFVTAAGSGRFVRMGLGGQVPQASYQAIIQGVITTDIVLGVRGAVSQSGNLQEWQDSTPTTHFAITAGGLPKWSAAGDRQTTVGAAGAASALPATPTKYLKVIDDAGATLVVPAYAS